MPKYGRYYLPFRNARFFFPLFLSSSLSFSLTLPVSLHSSQFLYSCPSLSFSTLLVILFPSSPSLPFLPSLPLPLSLSLFASSSLSSSPPFFFLKPKLCARVTGTHAPLLRRKKKRERASLLCPLYEPARHASNTHIIMWGTEGKRILRV